MSKNINSKNSISLIEEFLNWHPSLNQIEQFTLLQSLLKEWNNKVNLTRLINGNDFWISQIIDSLSPIKDKLNSSSSPKKIIDVGSGCGLPGLAIAIALPKSSLILVDSVRRKTNALTSITKDLGLHSRVSIINERIEVLGQDSSYRGSFDISLARAVAPTTVVAEYLVPLLSKTGEALIYKGKWESSDLHQLNNALFHLKAEIKKIEYIDLPENRGTRHAISIQTSGVCPSKYPRPIGIPKKNPLGSYTSDNL